ncbi:MAG: glycosyltransferase [Scytonema sp. PMC 1070.18]|nr:glycosyltransferase [Scytonema sp. PMC 1070.18]
MNIVSRVQFPKTTETSELYIRLSPDTSRDFDSSNPQIVLQSGSTISFNTYFNSIYEKYYKKYTTLKSGYYLLRLEGDFEVAVYRETNEAKTKELLSNQIIKDCQLVNFVKILLPEFKQNQVAGRIYLEITCLSSEGVFAEGVVFTEQEKGRDVSLAIITCTYKKEAYLQKTVNTILQDSLLQDKQFKIFVVDNGQTLSENDFFDKRVQLIPHRNVGGSGGFTKGLITALQEEVYTHFLFMDDDIELDSEALFRLFLLYEYAQQDFAVVGSMLDLYRKHIMYEAGALYNKYIDNNGNIKHCSFALTCLKNNLDLQDPTSLNLLLVEDKIDFSGFYFFSFSKEVVDSIGLPLPFFLKIDDLEFSLRVNEYLSDGIVAFPSLAVWHEPFYTKKPIWDLYYGNRNKLITDAIHDSSDFFGTLKYFTRNIIFYLLLFDYNTAQMYVKAFEDYMQGPDLLKNNDLETFHSKIFEYSKRHKSQTVLTNSFTNSEGYQVTKTGKLQKLLSLLTLNGHLLPKFLIRDESALVHYGTKEEERDSVCKGFAKKRIIFIQEKNAQSYQNELNNQAGLSILLAWFKAVVLSIGRWSNIRADWKTSAKDLTSIQFWQNHLEPLDKKQSQFSNYIKSGEVA